MSISNNRNTSFQIRNRLGQPLHSLSREKRVDTFNINVPDVSSFRASLGGIAKKNNVSLELVDSKGALVAASRTPRNASENIELSRLDPGTYKLRAILKHGQKTSYKLSFSSTVLPKSLPTPSPTPVPPVTLDEPPIVKPDLGGNLSATATSGGNIGSTVSTFSDAVGGSGDATDWYTFTVGETGFPSSRLKLGLTGDNGVAVHLFSANDLNAPLGSVATDSSNPSLSQSTAALAPGTYYVRARSLTGGKVNYGLNLSASGIEDSAGDSQDDARVINNLQPINTSGQSFSFKDFVGPGDIFDYYTFKTDAKSTLTINFNRLNEGNFSKARILYQLTKDGSTSGSPYWKNASGVSLSAGFSPLTQPSYTLTGTLEPGTYTLQLKSYFYDGDNSYNMTVSAMP